MLVYLDASAFVSIIVRDSGSAAVTSWLEDNPAILALSDFTWGELVSTLGRMVRNREQRAEEARAAMSAAQTFVAGWESFITTGLDVSVATDFVTHFDLGLRLPEAVHLAITRRHGATLVTTDRRQGDAAAALGIGYADPTRPA